MLRRDRGDAEILAVRYIDAAETSYWCLEEVVSFASSVFWFHDTSRSGVIAAHNIKENIANTEFILH